MVVPYPYGDRFGGDTDWLCARVQNVLLFDGIGRRNAFVSLHGVAS